MSRSNPHSLAETSFSSNTARDVLRDDFDKMNEEERVFLYSLAAEFIDMLESTERAMALRFEGQLFDIEEGNAFWSLLPAKVRTAIKRGGGK